MAAAESENPIEGLAVRPNARAVSGTVHPDTENRARYVHASAMLLAGSLVLFALTIYPLQFGPVERLVLAVDIVVLGIYETVIDGAFEGEG